MAHHVEMMDIDDIDSDFDNKENACHRGNVLQRTPCTEKGYEELDVSELNMKLRYSFTPASSPMSKSYTANCIDKNLSGDDTFTTTVDENSLTRSLNSTITRNDSIKSLKALPLQSLPTEPFAEQRNPVLRTLDSAGEPNSNNVSITVSGVQDIDENLSLPSSSSSAVHTPEATTPTKDIPKRDGGSPIMRGLKSVLNMFRPSQSPIPPGEDEVKGLESNMHEPAENTLKIVPDTVLSASTPLSHKTKEDRGKRSSPLKDSIVFNDDLEKELQWREDSTIIFSKEKIPIHKLFLPQTISSNKPTKDMDSTVEQMDISYNQSAVQDDTMKNIDDANMGNRTEDLILESDGEFVDCETFTRNESQLLADTINISLDENHDLNTTKDDVDSVNELKEVIANETVAQTNDLTQPLDCTQTISPLSNVNTHENSVPTDVNKHDMFSEIKNDLTIETTKVIDNNVTVNENSAINTMPSVNESVNQDSMIMGELVNASKVCMEIIGITIPGDTETPFNNTKDLSTILDSKLDSPVSDKVEKDFAVPNLPSDVPLPDDDAFDFGPSDLLRDDKVGCDSLLDDINELIGHHNEESVAPIIIDNIPRLDLSSLPENTTEIVPKTEVLPQQIVQFQSEIKNIDIVTSENIVSEIVASAEKAVNIAIEGHTVDNKEKSNTLEEIITIVETKEPTIATEIDAEIVDVKLVPQLDEVKENTVNELVVGNGSVSVLGMEENNQQETEIAKDEVSDNNLDDNKDKLIQGESIQVDALLAKVILDSNEENKNALQLSQEESKQADIQVNKDEAIPIDTEPIVTKEEGKIEAHTETHEAAHTETYEATVHNNTVPEEKPVTQTETTEIETQTVIEPVVDEVKPIEVTEISSDVCNKQDETVEIKLDTTNIQESTPIVHESAPPQEQVTIDNISIVTQETNNQEVVLTDVAVFTDPTKDINLNVDEPMDISIANDELPESISVNDVTSVVNDVITIPETETIASETPGNEIIETAVVVEDIKVEQNIPDFKEFTTVHYELENVNKAVDIISETVTEKIDNENTIKETTVEDTIPQINATFEQNETDVKEHTSDVTKATDIVDANVVSEMCEELSKTGDNQTIEQTTEKENSVEVKSVDVPMEVEQLPVEDVEIVVSENDSPYVSLSAEPEPVVEAKNLEFDEVDPFATKTKIQTSPPVSPKIVSKGYNFNFDEIDDPFATKTKIRLSPPPEGVNTTMNEDNVPVKPVRRPVNKNQRKSLPEKKKPVIPKNMNVTLDSEIKIAVDTIAKEEVVPQIEEANIENEPAKEPVVETVQETKDEEFENKCEVKEETETLQDLKVDADKPLETVSIEQQANVEETDVKVLSKTAGTSSSEHSTYFSAAASSSESFESKNVFNLPEIEDMNFNPFATKSKMRASPPPSERKSFTVDSLPEISTETQNPVNTTVNIDACSEDKMAVDATDKANEIPANVSNTTASSKDTEDDTVKEVNTEDEDTVEGPFLEADDLSDDKMSDFDGENVDMMQFNDLAAQEADDKADPGEMFIDAETFEFLMNQNANEVADSGKESLFLKFDPLFARRLTSEGVVAALSKAQALKKQSTPKKARVPPQSLNPPEPGPSNFNVTQDRQPTSVFDESNDELNVTVSKPTMVVTPAVNPVPAPRKSSTPTRNRLSMTFTSPAMAVIDRLLSLSSGNSPSHHNVSMPEINREQRDADLALTQLRELLAEKELHVHHLRSESKELKNRLTTLETQMQSLETIGEDRLKKINELNERLAEKTRINKSMATVVEEYERTIASLISETEQDKKRHAEERIKIIRERDEQTAHLGNMEASFSDLHSKYEKSKQIILGYKANEDIYKKSIKEFEENLAKMQTNYESLKQHATKKLNEANTELEKLNRAHESDVLKLNAMIKRKDLHITSLEETLAQKMKANDELTAICDELINKVG